MCFCGLTDASRMWYLKVNEMFMDMNLKKIMLDEAMHIWLCNGSVEGLLCIHVDDFIWIGGNEFREKVINKLKDIFCISRVQKVSNFWVFK